MQSANERRSSVRMEKNYPVIFAAKERRATSESYDISEKGLGFYSNFDMDIGDSIEVKIMPRDEAFSVTCDATIKHFGPSKNVNNYKYMVGVEFTEGLKDFATNQLVSGTERIWAKTSLIINANEQACYNAISDFESYPSWLNVVKRVKVLQKDSNLRPELVEFDFDFILKRIRVVNKYEYMDKDFVLSWKTVEGDIKAQEGSYVFKKLGNNRTNATVSGYFVTGFYIPKRALDYVTNVTLRKTIKALKDVVESGKLKKH